ncbi:FAD dependent oxidoreductase TIGR03364 [Tistlia consotensis]|uniref:FAD dependent oxidoreductase TIGR03364 n=1 Tax=Tistlia consotensis USBA 355 TaxID=560819 RepID=A0A1Y6C124_9PROT|nr:TIGR03364 family FAD-dependent oxidoreductase [Tistlia consotensis]SMF38753.1 FAD dependent oxidoreductase TIGR03364 [Tistlia consotensis USBA 355]SNR36873.1 FAD dependent oxidoreductase TIGR03364 [Tistlia consotensis]
MSGSSRAYDLAVVGGGILGLAHALAATRRGLRVVVVDRDVRANGASVRNFGFVTVTGQERGLPWRRALRSRDVWAEVAPQAGIRIEQRGLRVLARRPEALAVLEAFLATEMGEGCRLLTAAQAAEGFPGLAADGVVAALQSPHELRVESREAIPRLAAWLAERQGVDFLRPALVREVAPPRVETTAGRIEAGTVVVCPGDDFLSLYPERIAAYGLTRCLLHMMRVRPREAGFRLPCPVMSDLGLVRYAGYAALPEAAALRARLGQEQPRHLAEGIHLIAVAGADGSLVVGDSHRYDPTPHPFADAAVDRLILDELGAATGLAEPEVLERWTGTYASASDRVMLVDRPEERVRLVIVTGGTGASTGFAIGEEVIAELFGDARDGDERRETA